MRLSGMAILLLASLAFATGNHASLDVRIEGASASGGHLVVELFDGESRAIRRPIAERIAVVDDDGVVRVRFTGLRPGAYAVSAYYEQDRGGRIDTGFPVRPVERMGAKNAADGGHPPASWSSTTFTIMPGRTGHTVQLDSAGS